MTRKLVAIITVAVLFLVPAIAFAGGGDPESGFKIKPTLQSVTQTSVGLMWETHNSDTGQIAISLNPNMSGAVYPPVGGSAKRHKVTVSGLSTNTRYYYRVSADGDTSAVKSFLTSLPKGSRTPFRFLVYGDSRRATWYEDIIARYGDNDDHLPVCDSMEGYAPDFIVHVGDFVEDGNDTGEIENFFDVEEDLLASNPVLSTYGNHEFSGGHGTGNTKMDGYLIPSPGGSFSYYSTDYGNVHILVLSTGEGVWNSDNYDLLAPGSAQYQFAQNDLQAAAADPDIDHIFVALHVPPYSAANFGDNNTLIGYLEPLFIANGVKAVFMGHEHDYQRMEKNGVQYILSGGAGSPVMDMPWLGDDNDTDANLLKYDDVLNYVVIDVYGGTVYLQARKVQGNGNSSSSVIESFTL